MSFEALVYKKARVLKLNTRGFFEAASDLFSLLMLISSEYLV